MATITKTFAENGGNGTRGSWTLSISGTDYVLSSNSFNLYEMLSCNARYTNSQTRGYGYARATFYLTVGTGTGRIYFFRGDNGESGRNGCIAMASGTSYVVPKTETIVNTNPVYTSWLFNSNNPNDRTYEIVASITSSGIFLRSCNSTMEYDTSYSSTSADTWGTIATITLDVPPTATVSAMSYDTGYVYAGLTTASVTVSGATAYYGGTITSSTLTIGNQTASISDNGTLSILLDTVGTFTPTVTITDSRGQTKTETLAPITVNGYVAPSVNNISIERTDTSGVADDEGVCAVITANINWAYAIADLTAPTVVVKDLDGVTQTSTTTWYTTRSSSGVSNAISDWSQVVLADMPIYGLVDNTGHNLFNTQYSYNVAVTPNDDISSGTTITRTIGSAFYTVDFLAGGHGIAFGKPASNVGFECAMDATFEDTLTAQDMSAQEVQDFIDSLQVGGGGVAVDLVVEQGTSGIWTYRKWLSGLAECWGTYTHSVTSWSAWGSLYEAKPVAYTTYPTGLFIMTPFVMIENATTANGICGIEKYNGTPSKDQTPNFHFLRPSTGSALTAYANIYAKGRWQ